MFNKQNRYYIIIAIVSFLVYGVTCNNDFVLDDGIYIEHHNSVQKGIAGLGEIFSRGSTYEFNKAGAQQPYRPLTLSTFAIGKSLYDNAPQVEHFMNVLLIGILACVLFYLLSLWLPNIPIGLRLLICLLFVVHPIHSEVIANIKSRDEILALLFGLLSFVQLYKYSESKKMVNILLACFFMFCSLLSKEVAITFIAVAPLSLYFFGGNNIIESIKKSWPILIPASLYLFIRSLIKTGVSDGSENDIMNNVLNMATNVSERFATIFSILFDYIKLLIYPYPLLSDYSYSHLQIQQWSSPTALLGVLLYACMIILAIVLFKRKSIYSFCIIFFISTISIFTNIVVFAGTAMAERFLFTPSLAFCIALPVLFYELLQRKQKTDKALQTTNYIMGGLIVILAILSFNRSQDWKNNFTLFKADIVHAPTNARLNYWLGTAYKSEAASASSQNEFVQLMNESENCFKESIRLYPDFNLGLYNLGVLYYETGRVDQAKIVYTELLKKYPNDINTLNNMGVIEFNNNAYQNAIPYFRAALKSDSLNVQAMGNLGACYQNLGNTDSAKIWYEIGLGLDPQNQEILNNRSKL